MVNISKDWMVSVRNWGNHHYLLLLLVPLLHRFPPDVWPYAPYFPFVPCAGALWSSTAALYFGQQQLSPMRPTKMGQPDWSPPATFFCDRFELKGKSLHIFNIYIINVKYIFFLTRLNTLNWIRLTKDFVFCMDAFFYYDTFQIKFIFL